MTLASVHKLVVCRFGIQVDGLCGDDDDDNPLDTGYVNTCNTGYTSGKPALSDTPGK